MIMQVDKLMKVLKGLRERNIWFSIQYVRGDAVSISACVPGERWEIDFSCDGTIDVEVFKSDGTIFDESKIPELFHKG